MDELLFVTARLRRLGAAAGSVLVLSAVVFASGLGLASLGSFAGVVWGRTLVGLSIELSTVTLFAVARHEGLRRRGDVLHLELSYEYQQRAREVVSQSLREPDSDIEESFGVPIEVRLALRQFKSESSLPIVAGAAGPAVYAAVSIVLIVAAGVSWPTFS